MAPSAPITNADANARTGEEPTSGRSSAVWLWAIVALGAALRLIALGYKSFWLDEIASVVTTRLPGNAFWSMLWHEEGNMALYYVLLRPWLHLGTGEASVRLLSVVPGIASIPVMYFLGRRLFGPRTGMLAAIFLALNACAIGVSQEARSYSLLVFAVLLSTYLFVCLIERPSYAMACAYGLVAGLTFYCQYFGLLVPAAHAVSLAALPQDRRPWKQLSLAACIIAVAAVPVLWMIHIQNLGHITWVPRLSWLEVYHLGAYFAAGSGKAIGAILLALDLALVGLFLSSLGKLWRDRRQDLRCWRYALPASSLLTPTVIALLASIPRPIFYHRFLIIGLPAWVLMTAVGAEKIRNPKGRRAAIAGVCVLSLASTMIGYTRVQEDWRGVTRYLMAQAQPGDRVLYYQSEGYFAVENYRNWLAGGDAPRPQAVIVQSPEGDWAQQMDHAPRVWLVLYRARTDDPATRSIQSQLGNSYAQERQASFRAVTVIEYRAQP